MVAAKKPTKIGRRRSELAAAQADWRRDDERLELQRAELEATLDSLRRLVSVIRGIGGYLEHQDQAALREAEARLVQHGRSVEQAPARSSR